MKYSINIFLVSLVLGQFSGNALGAVSAEACRLAAIACLDSCVSTGSVRGKTDACFQGCGAGYSKCAGSASPSGVKAVNNGILPDTHSNSGVSPRNVDLNGRVNGNIIAVTSEQTTHPIDAKIVEFQSAENHAAIMVQVGGQTFAGVLTDIHSRVEDLDRKPAGLKAPKWARELYQWAQKAGPWGFWERMILEHIFEDLPPK